MNSKLKYSKKCWKNHKSKAYVQLNINEFNKMRLKINSKVFNSAL